MYRELLAMMRGVHFSSDGALSRGGAQPGEGPMMPDTTPEGTVHRAAPVADLRSISAPQEEAVLSANSQGRLLVSALPPQFAALVKRHQLEAAVQKHLPGLMQPDQGPLSAEQGRCLALTTAYTATELKKRGIRVESNIHELVSYWKEESGKAKTRVTIGELAAYFLASHRTLEGLSGSTVSIKVLLHHTIPFTRLPNDASSASRGKLMEELRHNIDTIRKLLDAAELPRVKDAPVAQPPANPASAAPVAAASGVPSVSPASTVSANTVPRPFSLGELKAAGFVLSNNFEAALLGWLKTERGSLAAAQYDPPTRVTGISLGDVAGYLMYQRGILKQQQALGRAVLGYREFSNHRLSYSHHTHTKNVFKISEILAEVDANLAALNRLESREFIEVPKAEPEKKLSLRKQLLLRRSAPVFERYRALAATGLPAQPSVDTPALTRLGISSPRDLIQHVSRWHAELGMPNLPGGAEGRVPAAAVQRYLRYTRDALRSLDGHVRFIGSAGLGVMKIHSRLPAEASVGLHAAIDSASGDLRKLRQLEVKHRVSMALQNDDSAARSLNWYRRRHMSMGPGIESDIRQFLAERGVETRSAPDGELLVTLRQIRTFWQYSRSQTQNLERGQVTPAELAGLGIHYARDLSSVHFVSRGAVHRSASRNENIARLLLSSARNQGSGESLDAATESLAVPVQVIVDPEVVMASKVQGARRFNVESLQRLGIKESGRFSEVMDEWLERKGVELQDLTIEGVVHYPQALLEKYLEASHATVAGLKERGQHIVGRRTLLAEGIYIPGVDGKQVFSTDVVLGKIRMMQLLLSDDQRSLTLLGEVADSGRVLQLTKHQLQAVSHSTGGSVIRNYEAWLARSGIQYPSDALPMGYVSIPHLRAYILRTQVVVDQLQVPLLDRNTMDAMLIGTHAWNTKRSRYGAAVVRRELASSLALTELCEQLGRVPSMAEALKRVPRVRRSVDEYADPHLREVQMPKYEELKRGETKVLWEEYFANRNWETQKKLSMGYLGTVRVCAEKIARDTPVCVDPDDLFEEGYLGLLEAIEHFDRSKNDNFRSYATRIVTERLRDHLREIDWAPRLVRYRSARVEMATERIFARTGVEPTLAEMRDELDRLRASEKTPKPPLKDDEFEKVLKDGSAVGLSSIHEPLGGGNGSIHGVSSKTAEVGDIIAAPFSTPASTFLRQDFWKDVLRHFNRAERMILTLYYREGMSMKEIGGVLDLSESRVSQMHTSIMERLKASDVIRGYAEDSFAPEGEED